MDEKPLVDKAQAIGKQQAELDRVSKESEERKRAEIEQQSAKARTFYDALQLFAFEASLAIRNLDHLMRSNGVRMDTPSRPTRAEKVGRTGVNVERDSKRYDLVWFVRALVPIVEDNEASIKHRVGMDTIVVLCGLAIDYQTNMIVTYAHRLNSEHVHFGPDMDIVARVPTRAELYADLVPILYEALP